MRRSDRTALVLATVSLCARPPRDRARPPRDDARVSSRTHAPPSYTCSSSRPTARRRRRRRPPYPGGVAGRPARTPREHLRSSRRGAARARGTPPSATCPRGSSACRRRPSRSTCHMRKVAHLGHGSLARASLWCVSRLHLGCISRAGSRSRLLIVRGSMQKCSKLVPATSAKLSRQHMGSRRVRHAAAISRGEKTQRDARRSAAASTLRS